MKLAAIVTYPIAGALFALGALGVVYYFGSQAARPLGRSAGYGAGEGFAEGMATAQLALKKLTEASNG
jgi:hypothetical protein